MQAFSSEPTTEPVPEFAGVRRAVVDGYKMTLTRYDLEAGASFPLHSHPEEQITLVLEGDMGFDVDGELHYLKQGAVIVIPGGSSHSATAGPRGAKIACVVTPKRGSAPTVTIDEDER